MSKHRNIDDDLLFVIYDVAHLMPRDADVRMRSNLITAKIADRKVAMR